MSAHPFEALASAKEAEKAAKRDEEAAIVAIGELLGIERSRLTSDFWGSGFTVACATYREARYVCEQLERFDALEVSGPNEDPTFRRWHAVAKIKPRSSGPHYTVKL